MVINEMEIKRGELSEKENDIATLYGIELDDEIYDFNVSDNVKSLTIKRYSLDKDKKWKIEEEFKDISNSSGKILISLNKNYDLMYSKVVKGGGNVVTLDSKLTYSDYTAINGISQESSKIVLNEEIPLVLKVFKKEGATAPVDLTSYKNPENLKDYEDAILITITFSS